MRIPGVVGRYLYPARVVPPTWGNLSRVAGSLRAAARSADTAAAYPSAIGIDVSDACNIACKVCSREIDWDRRATALLSFDDFCRIYDQIRPLYLSLSGYGETLLNKALPRMVAHATAGGSLVNVVTNGTLLDDGKASALLDAGLAKLKVSIDAAEAAVYAHVRERGDLDVVVRNVEKLVLMRDARRLGGPQVEVQFTMFRENLDQVSKLIELCHTRLPTVEPYFHVMFTYGEQPLFVERGLPHGDPTALAVFAEAEALARTYGYVRTASSLRTATAQLTRDLSRAPCYVPWYSCLISTDGDVYPCCYQSIRGVKVGNVLREPFAEIWNGPAMQAFRRGLREDRCGDKVCATCRYEDEGMEKVFRWARAVPGVR